MIIVARGHTPDDPGARDLCLTEPELYYNERVCSVIEREWAAFKGGRVVRSKRPCWASRYAARHDNGVYDVIDQATRLGVDARVEVHHNHAS